MSSTEKMLNYIPDYLRTSRVITSILSADGTEQDQINTNLADTLLQFYAETATETGLTLWEHFLNLSSYASKPLDQRRSRIISKIRGIGTVTVALIQNVAESYVYGTVTVTEHPDSYSFTIKFVDPKGVPANLDDVKAAIEDLKPAHLAVNYEFTYTTWGEVKAIAWADVKTGTWEELKTRMVV